MKRARVAYAGAVHEAVPHARGLELADGRVLAERRGRLAAAASRPARSSRSA